MERLCKELEDMKLKVESLTEECRVKTAISGNLKRVNSEQAAKLKEAKEENERRSREIDAKDEEIFVAKQSYEDLKAKFAEKESALKHLNHVNENLKSSHAEKVKKLEVENGKLISALDEAKIRREEQDNMLSSYKQEIDKLKSLLSSTKKKCVDAEQSAKAPKEVKRRDSMISRLEQDNAELEEQLKWRSEQFKHLEEALEKNQEKFRACKKEWEMEKANLLDEISSLQTNLDSQTRIAEDLKSKLQMCNQALAHEESRRKMLEVQMSESKALYENVMSEYEDNRFNINSLGGRRDEEIAELRNSLATKSTLAKELEFKITYIEQENEELHSDLKELQEAQINGASTSSSLKTLQQKFRALEQTHRSCSEKLKSRYAEWSMEKERLNAELDESLMRIQNKDKELQSVHAELEAAFSSLMHRKLENEGISVVLLILQSKYTEICLNVEEFKLESEHYIKKAEERISLLTRQLEVKEKDCMHSRDEIKQEHERANSLLSKIEHMDSMEKDYELMQKEIVSYKELVEESSKKLEQLKLQASDKENELLNEIKRSLAALDQANYTLFEKTGLLSKLEFELEQSKLGCDRLEKIKSDLEAELKNYRDERVLIEKELEDALLVKVEAEKKLLDRNEVFVQTLKEEDKKIEYLQQQIVLIEEEKLTFEASGQAKLDYENLIEVETRKVNQFVEDIGRSLKCSQAAVDSLVQNYVYQIILNAEMEEEIKLLMLQVEEDKMLSIELLTVLEEGKMMLDKQCSSKEQDCSKYAQIADSIKDAQMELYPLHEAMENVFAVYVLDKQEIYYKDDLLVELEKEIGYLEQKAEEDRIRNITETEKRGMMFQQIIEEKENVIAAMKQKILSYEHEISTVYILFQQDIYYKNMLVIELENEIQHLQIKLKSEEETSLDLKNYVNQFEVKLADLLLEKENERKILVSQVLSLETNVQRLKSEKRSVCELLHKLSSDKEDATSNLKSVGNMIEEIYDRSEEIKKKWNRVLQITTHDESTATNIEADNLHGSKKMYSKVLGSPSRSRRSPLKEQNC